MTGHSLALVMVALAIILMSTRDAMNNWRWWTSTAALAVVELVAIHSYLFHCPRP